MINKIHILIFVCCIFCGKAFCNHITDTVKLIEPIIIEEIEEEVLGSEKYPAEIISDKNPVQITSTDFIIEVPQMIEPFSWADRLPAYMKQKYKMDFLELYHIHRNIITEKYILLRIRIYSHNENAVITYDGQKVSVVANTLGSMLYTFLYILQDNGKYKMFYIPESPYYDLIEGNHADTFGDVLPILGRKYLTEAVLNYYLKENGLSEIELKQQKVKKKYIKYLKRRYESW